MDGIRPRLLGLVEWLAAAGCVFVTVVAVASLSREVRHVRPIVPVKAEAARPPLAPGGLRPGAIAVPELILPDGKILSTGQSASTLGLLGPRAQSGPTEVERDGSGERQSRTYRYAGMEFVVVTANDEIVAIYR